MDAEFSLGLSLIQQNPLIIRNTHTKGRSHLCKSRDLARSRKYTGLRWFGHYEQEIGCDTVQFSNAQLVDQSDVNFGRMGMDRSLRAEQKQGPLQASHVGKRWPK